MAFFNNSGDGGGGAVASVFGRVGAVVAVDEDYASVGLKLGGVAAENLLDDYEEGTWTAEIDGASGAGPGTYTRNTGNYIKVGNVVTVSMYMTWSALGSLSGGATITGLPFATKAGTDKFQSGNAGWASSLNIPSGSSMGFQIPAGATTFSIQLWDNAGGASQATIAELSASGSIMFNITYLTD